MAKKTKTSSTKRKLAKKPAKKRAAKHVCETCGKKYKTGTAYDAHMARAHRVASGRGRHKHTYYCGHCSGAFKTQRSFDSHKKRIHGLAPTKRARPDKRSPEQHAVAFFMKHAGGVVGKKREGAKELARCEAEARRRGWSVSWETEEDPDISWMSDEEREQSHEVLYAALRDEEGNHLASLGGITDPDRNYCRVVEAELACEALGDVK